MSPAGKFRNRVSHIIGRPGPLVFPVLAVASLVVLLLLARHSSTNPEVLGRWTSRYAALLAFQTLATLSLAALGVPALRVRLFTQRAWKSSMRLAYAHVAAGLALLPLVWLLLRRMLFPEKDAVLVLFANLVLMMSVALVTLVLWRKGITSLGVSLAPRTVLLPLIAGQLLLTAIFLGQVPAIDIHDEIRVIGNSLRQFAQPDRFILLQPERNPSTWFYFQGFWVLSGAWMHLFGAGLFQARIFHLLIAWLGVPFLYFVSRKLSGQKAALVAASCGIVLPLHFVTARSDVWVGTATTIALFFLVLARHPETTRARLYGFLCGVFALSAVDGHIYGIAFALMIALLYLTPLLRVLRGNAGRPGQGSVLGFAAGCLACLVFQVLYHLVLPGVNPFALPDLVQQTLKFETNLGESIHGTGLTSDNILKFFQLFLYYNPYALVLAAIGVVLALKHGIAAVRDSLFIGFGAGLVIFLTLAHFSKFYPLFWLPFVCLWSGTALSEIFASDVKKPRDKNVWSPGSLYLLLALILLSTIQLVETANVRERDLKRVHLLTGIGQEVDKLIPADITVAGTAEIYIGMPWRLNYGGSCAFTHSDPAYWPLDPPQAVISTPGWDRACHQLADWLTEHDFQPARCFSGHDLGEGVTILYLSPELMPSGAAIDCTSEDLAQVHNR